MLLYQKLKKWNRNKRKDEKENNRMANIERVLEEPTVTWYCIKAEIESAAVLQRIESIAVQIALQKLKIDLFSSHIISEKRLVVNLDRDKNEKNIKLDN